MFVVSIVPLRRGSHIDTLSYFSSEAYESGALVTVPIRNSDALGLVTKCEPVSATKTALRAATFSLRKLPQQTNTQSLSPQLITTAEELAQYYATEVGTVLYALLSPAVRNGDIPLPHTHHVPPTEQPAPEVLQGTKRERYLAYRSLVRETLAHSGSTLCVVPTSVEAEEMEALLSQGIEERVITLTSTMTKKALREAYQKLDDFSKQKLIIATPSHAILERHDITTILMEHERSPHYRERTRPYLDYRDVLRIHARHTGRRIVFGDLLPRTEEEFYRRSDRYQTFGSTPKRLELPGAISIISQKKERDAGDAFELFSQPVIDALMETREKKGRAFLFAARRGLAPLVACFDCGFIFRSPDTGAPYSLLRIRKDGTETRWFVCSTSGKRVRAADTCPECGSWRLRERGIGIQQVYDELLKKMPRVPVTVFDHTTASTFKKAQFLRETFYSTKGSIMLGTQMAVPYLTEPIETSVIVNMDALYATPTWRLEEENLALLLRLREQTTGTVYIQTRIDDELFLKRAKQASVEQFYNEELELRKTFNYPPHTVFIHLTWQGSKEEVQKLEQHITHAFTNFSIATYPCPTSSKDTRIMYGLLRIAATDWPHEKIRTILRSLPPSVRVMINPDRIV